MLDLQKSLQEIHLQADQKYQHKSGKLNLWALYFEQSST